MLRSLTGIEEKVSKIETDTTEFFQEFQHFYRQYLKLLGYSIEQQLILAAHHICTEIYPDTFLRLTFNQRQRLQDRIRKLGRQFETDLFVLLKNQAELLIEPEESGESEESEESEENYPSEITETDGSESKPKTVPINTANPDELLHWSRSVEYGVRETLEKISKEANSLLRGAAILSNAIPAKVIEMALEAEENGIGMNRSGHPNILNLLIEATAVSELKNDHENGDDDDGDDDDEMPNHSSITKITAIHLRLAEIEFGDPNLSHARKQLRNFLERLGKLRKQYRQLKREYLTVEAKNAWRSSWSEN